jgi:hypothetical protein
LWGGFRPEPNIRLDSGTRLEKGPAKYDLATMSCAAINEDDGRPGFGESAFAEDGYLKASGDPAWEATMTTTGPVDGTVNMDVLTVATGDDVVTINTTGYNRPVPADPSARTLMSVLITRLHTAG